MLKVQNPLPPTRLGNISWRQRVAGLARRHPLVTFLVIFNIFGQALAFTPVIADSVYGIELDREIILIVATILFLLLPALTITRIARGPDGLKALLRSMVKFRIPWRWYLLPLLVLPALTLAATLSAPPGGLDPRTLLMAYLTGYLPALLFQFVTTNWWEETAWMGFVQAPLQQRFSPWKAVLITSLLFAFAHISALVEGTIGQIAVKFALLTVVAIAIRALLGWVYNRTGSIAFVGLVHAASNASTFALVPELYHHTGDAAIPFLLLAVGAIALSRGRLQSRHGSADIPAHQPIAKPTPPYGLTKQRATTR